MYALMLFISAFSTGFLTYCLLCIDEARTWFAWLILIINIISSLLWICKLWH